MPGVLELVVYALANARLTGIITTDEILETERDQLIEKINPDDLEHGWRHKLAYLFTCQWCMGFWVALLATVPAWHWLGHLLPVQLAALVLACSQVTGMISDMGRD